MNLSGENMSHEENNISAQMKTASKQNVLYYRLRHKRKDQNFYKMKSQSPNPRIRQRKCSNVFVSLPTSISRWGNYPSTPLYPPITRQRHSSVYPTREFQNDYSKSVFEHKNFSAFHSQSSISRMSSEPPFHSHVVLNDTTHRCNKTTECNDNLWSKKQLYCSAARASDQEASSNTHKLVSECIRNSYFPISTTISTTISTSSCFNQFLNSKLTNSTPNAHSTSETDALENISQNTNLLSIYPSPTPSVVPMELQSHTKNSPNSTKSCGISNHLCSSGKKGISPCSTVVEFGSMESVLEYSSNSFSTAKPLSLSEISLFLSESKYYAPCNSSISSSSDEESWDSEDDNETINQSLMRLNLVCLPFEGNSTYSKPLLDENSQVNNPQKVGDSSKSIRFPVRRQCLSQLPSNTSTFRDESKNVTGSISHPSHSVICHQPVKAKASNRSKTTKLLFQENAHIATLDNNDSLKMSSFCRVESEPYDDGDLFSTLKPSVPLKSSKERHRVVNIVENEGKSLASLSMKYDPATTDASEMVICSNEPSSVPNAPNNNKARKKSKLISCFTACLRPSSP